MLVECGLVRAATDDPSGSVEFTFRPSFGRIAALGSLQEIVRIYARLHGPNAATEAAHVLAGLCDQDDLSALIGEPEPTDIGVVFRGGAMPAAERVTIARHLMRHGIMGKARPHRRGDGGFSDRFDASEYVAAACVHLGLSSADAEALSMTEFQQMFEMKFPEARGPDLPSREEYEAASAAIDAIHAAKVKARG